MLIENDDLTMLKSFLKSRFLFISYEFLTRSLFILFLCADFDDYDNTFKQNYEKISHFSSNDVLVIL
jgi:hypothetical protein